jgi:hypothetical protein
MAVVELCPACENGNHEACHGGSGGEKDAAGNEKDGLLFCCTCEVCAARGETEKSSQTEVARWIKGAHEVLNQPIGSMLELYALLHIFINQLGEKLRANQQ